MEPAGPRGGAKIGQILLRAGPAKACSSTRYPAAMIQRLPARLLLLACCLLLSSASNDSRAANALSMESNDLHPCETGTSRCDPLSTTCKEVTGKFYLCLCLDGFDPDRANPSRCIKAALAAGGGMAPAGGAAGSEPA